MATANPFGRIAPETRIDEDQYPVFKSAFNDELRHELIDEDIFAGKSVCGVLITVVTLGLLFGIVTVFLLT